MLKCNSWIANKFPAFLLLFINFFVYFLCGFIHRWKLSKAFLLHCAAVKAGLFSETTEWAWNQILMSNTILASHINETKNTEGKKRDYYATCSSTRCVRGVSLFCNGSGADFSFRFRPYQFVCITGCVSGCICIPALSQLQRPGLHHSFFIFARAQRSNSAQSRLCGTGRMVWKRNHASG